MMKLIQFCEDWADEFECEEMRILTESEYEDWRAGWDARDDEDDVYFGTNESWMFGEIRDAIEVIDITDEDAAVIIRLLGPSFGTGPL